MFQVDFAKFRINLRKARTIKELTAKELSEQAGLKQLKRVADIEEGRGSPSLDEVHSLCVVLGQPMDEMLGLESEICLRWKGKLVSKQYDSI